MVPTYYDFGSGTHRETYIRECATIAEDAWLIKIISFEIVNMQMQSLLAKLYV
jgi:hypothetical protein